MWQGEPRSVERVTRHLEEREVLLRQHAVGPACEARLVGTVELVADDRGTERGQVDCVADAATVDKARACFLTLPNSLRQEMVR